MSLTKAKNESSARIIYQSKSSSCKYMSAINLMPRNIRMALITIELLAILDYLKVSYYILKRRHLPAPFETNCLDYQTIGFHVQKHCYDSCLMKTMASYQRVPFSVISVAGRNKDAFYLRAINHVDLKMLHSQKLLTTSNMTVIKSVSRWIVCTRFTLALWSPFTVMVSSPFKLSCPVILALH